MKSVKTILITQFALPYEGIGSWTTMYNYYLNQAHHIDIIIGPTPKQKLEGITYYGTEKNVMDKLQSKWSSANRYQHIFKILKDTIEKGHKYIIQLIDNHGIVVPLNLFLKEAKLREQCYLQFFYHGYPPFYGNFESRSFFEALDEHVMLTHASYKTYQDQYTQLPCSFSVLSNGVDSELFYKPAVLEKQQHRKILGIEADTLLFVWCSKDRPKKGLDFILQVWKQLVQTHADIELWVIGTERVIDTPQVKVIGKIPNAELPKYYQAADFYLFPTLCHEGFGLSLVEAIKCDCYAIASANGGVPEVLNHGMYGRLIENPNFRDEWVEAIEEGIVSYKANGLKNPYSEVIPYDLYDIKQWCSQMNAYIEKAKIAVDG
jgi:glycosyltransferase involved in cell wall biosynthesis